MDRENCSFLRWLTSSKKSHPIWSRKRVQDQGVRWNRFLDKRAKKPWADRHQLAVGDVAMRKNPRLIPILWRLLCPLPESRDELSQEDWARTGLGKLGPGPWSQANWVVRRILRRLNQNWLFPCGSAGVVRFLVRSSKGHLLQSTRLTGDSKAIKGRSNKTQLVGSSPDSGTCHRFHTGTRRGTVRHDRLHTVAIGLYCISTLNTNFQITLSWLVRADR